MIINPLVKDDLSHNFEEKVKRLTNALANTREIRSCGTCDGTFVLFGNPTIGIICLILFVLLLLILLGIFKGLLGVYCCPPVGMCGLGALIDLPRPLHEYQEEELADFPVKYDMIGWPVHPQTNKRTVRAISLKSEFCLNVIFFLTYPMIMLITLLTTCCFNQVYDNEDTTDMIYKKDHTIMLTECPSIICRRNTNQEDHRCVKDIEIYHEESAGEENDTQYVYDQLRKSEEQMRYSQAYS